MLSNLCHCERCSAGGRAQSKLHRSNWEHRPSRHLHEISLLHAAPWHTPGASPKSGWPPLGPAPRWMPPSNGRGGNQFQARPHAHSGHGCCAFVVAHACTAANGANPIFTTRGGSHTRCHKNQDISISRSCIRAGQDSSRRLSRTSGLSRKSRCAGLARQAWPPYCRRGELTWPHTSGPLHTCRDMSRQVERRLHVRCIRFHSDSAARVPHTRSAMRQARTRQCPRQHNKVTRSTVAQQTPPRRQQSATRLSVELRLNRHSQDRATGRGAPPISPEQVMPSLQKNPCHIVQQQGASAPPHALQRRSYVVSTLLSHP